MKDRFDFSQYENDAKNDILIQIRVSGESMTKDRLDGLNYRFYEKRFGKDEMKRSYITWVAVSEDLYRSMKNEGLLDLGKNTVRLTEEGKKATKMGYTKYLLLKKWDLIFGQIKKLGESISSASTGTKWIIAVCSLLISAILYITGLIWR